MSEFDFQRKKDLQNSPITGFTIAKSEHKAATACVDKTLAKEPDSYSGDVNFFSSEVFVLSAARTVDEL